MTTEPKKKTQESNKEETLRQSRISPSLLLDADECITIRAPLRIGTRGIMKNIWKDMGNAWKWENAAWVYIS